MGLQISTFFKKNSISFASGCFFYIVLDSIKKAELLPSINILKGALVHELGLRAIFQTSRLLGACVCSQRICSKIEQGAILAKMVNELTSILKSQSFVNVRYALDGAGGYRPPNSILQSWRSIRRFLCLCFCSTSANVKNKMASMLGKHQMIPCQTCHGCVFSGEPCVISLVLSVMQVSQAAAELQQYCMQNACKDALLVGVPAGSNPFREPRSCTLL